MVKKSTNSFKTKASGLKRISWKAPEFVHYTKDIYWFLGLGLGSLFLVGFAVWMRNWFMVAAFVLASIALVIVSRRKPEVVDHEITEEGIKVGNRFYSFSKLKSFWIIKTSPFPTLNFEPTRKISPVITLQLGKVDLDQIRQFLGRYLPEQEGRGEDIFDKITRILKI